MWLWTIWWSNGVTLLEISTNFCRKISILSSNMLEINFMVLLSLLQNSKPSKQNMPKLRQLSKRKSKRFTVCMILINGNFPRNSWALFQNNWSMIKSRPSKSCFQLRLAPLKNQRQTYFSSLTNFSYTGWKVMLGIANGTARISNSLR